MLAARANRAWSTHLLQIRGPDLLMSTVSRKMQFPSSSTAAIMTTTMHQKALAVNTMRSSRLPPATQTAKSLAMQRKKTKVKASMQASTNTRTERKTSHQRFSSKVRALLHLAIKAFTQITSTITPLTSTKKYSTE